ncbi:alpha/beta-hydrolase [Schizopora paradoxa]|uniref:Alpha/beta-hydrolase n=1 Tax=Schizopora paradoxa TaxID=27342 RepID=A0A0H2RW40_9AGAM|nr:alpha/beta-hydrolase [Schizopora paradoxa]
MPNALTRHVGLNAGTWVLETLVKHYFNNVFKNADMPTAAAETVNDRKEGSNAKLRREEILYDEAFHIIKSFMDASTHHTVEELQRFSNAHTPSPPWMHVLRFLIPMSCCNEAADILVKALGGEEVTRRVVGGTKWWQVRGLKGVDAQWIVAKKDYHKAMKQKKEFERMSKERGRGRTQNREEARNDSEEVNGEGDESMYRPEMDQMRCILYFHGGGYYFGSVDQERYFLQRFARKSGARLLAINYRLAPQYPFPCAIHDAIAAYLFLIRPPEGARHTKVDPANIVVGGDSAGGGLAIALLQVIRDTGLPMPAGGVLISPWCDLTHSFPSIHLNTDSDIIPKYGLALHKPSPLWPPPPDEITTRVQARLRSHIKDLFRHDSRSEKRNSSHLHVNRVFCNPIWKRSKSADSQRERRTASSSATDIALSRRSSDVRASAISHLSNGSVDLQLGQEGPLPTAVDPNSSQTISLRASNGEELVVHDQVQLYCSNNLVVHPLVSPALSYLGGLPELLVIASDAEVLRDEILYSAHKAAHPDRYKVKPEAREMYPSLEGIEERYGPTKVHLQVYDEAAHVLPVLFSFTTPAKFCFRAMALFCKYVTGALPPPEPQLVLDKDHIVASPPETPPTSPKFPSFRRALSLTSPRRSSSMMGKHQSSTMGHSKTVSVEVPRSKPPIPSLLVSNVHAEDPEEMQSSANPDDDGQRSSSSSEDVPPLRPKQESSGSRHAGEASVYSTASSLDTPQPPTSPFSDNMIRERVSTRGEIRPLEPEEELVACNMPIENIGVVAELAIRRYVEGRGKWDARFSRVMKSVEKHRRRNLDIAKKEVVRNVSQLQMHFFQNTSDQAEKDASKVKEGLRKTAASWAWAWAIDDDERPPASSIVARRDTEEARRLSKIADFPIFGDEHNWSGNNLWSYIVNVLTSDKGNKDAVNSKERDQTPSSPVPSQKKTSVFRRLITLSTSTSSPG